MRFLWMVVARRCVVGVQANRGIRVAQRVSCNVELLRVDTIETRFSSGMRATQPVGGRRKGKVGWQWHLLGRGEAAR